MGRRVNFWVVVVLIALSFTAGTLLGPGGALIDSKANAYSGATCHAMTWKIHSTGIFTVKADAGLKMIITQATDNLLKLDVNKK